MHDCDRAGSSVSKGTCLATKGHLCRTTKGYIHTRPKLLQISRSGNLITNNDVFEIALIGMSGIDFIDLFLDISETDFMAVIIEDL